MHQCYYCEQLFESKEQLYEHVEVHSDIERNKEITEKRKKEKINFLLNYYQSKILKKIRVKVENFTFRSGYNNSVLNLYGLG